MPGEMRRERAADFEFIAAEMGKLQAANEADCDEFAALLGKLEQVYDELEDAHEEHVLVPLLNSSDGYVRLYAAKMLLLTDPASALVVLEEIRSAKGPRNLAANAVFTIHQWQNGFLFAYRRAKGRRAPSASFPNR